MRSVLTGKAPKKGDFGAFSVFSKCSNSVLEKKKILKPISFFKVLDRFFVPVILLFEPLCSEIFDDFKKSLFLENSDFFQFMQFFSIFAKFYQNSVQNTIFHFASISHGVF